MTVVGLDVHHDGDANTSPPGDISTALILGRRLYKSASYEQCLQLLTRGGISDDQLLTSAVEFYDYLCLKRY